MNRLTLRVLKAKSYAFNSNCYSDCLVIAKNNIKLS